MYPDGVRFDEVVLSGTVLEDLSLKIYNISFYSSFRVCIISQIIRLIIGYNVYSETPKRVEENMKVLDGNSSTLSSNRFIPNDTLVFMGVEHLTYVSNSKRLF